MVKCFLYVFTEDDETRWVDGIHEFGRVPSSGDHIELNQPGVGAQLFEVLRVLHRPILEPGQHAAEVWLVHRGSVLDFIKQQR